MIVRRYKKEDIPLLLDYIEDYMEESPVYRLYAFNRTKMGKLLLNNLTNETFFCMLVESEGLDGREKEIQAGLCGRLTQMFFTDDSIAVDYLFYVRPKFRGSYAAHRLVLMWIAWARARGAKQVRLEQTSGIDPAGFERFALAEGFKELGRAFVIDL